MPDLSGAVALVTGGGGGIGAALVKQLGANGAKVCALDIDEEAAQRSGADLAIGADVSRPGSDGGSGGPGGHASSASSTSSSASRASHTNRRACARCGRERRNG